MALAIEPCFIATSLTIWADGLTIPPADLKIPIAA